MSSETSGGISGQRDYFVDQYMMNKFQQLHWCCSVFLTHAVAAARSI
jgi:hypothetical protein